MARPVDFLKSKFGAVAQAGELWIELQGVGCSDWKWRVRGEEQADAQLLLQCNWLKRLDDGWLEGVSAFGRASIWMEEATIFQAIVDLVENQ